MIRPDVGKIDMRGTLALTDDSELVIIRSVVKERGAYRAETLDGREVLLPAPRRTLGNVRDFRPPLRVWASRHLSPGQLIQSRHPDPDSVLLREARG